MMSLDFRDDTDPSEPSSEPVKSIQSRDVKDTSRLSILKHKVCLVILGIHLQAKRLRLVPEFDLDQNRCSEGLLPERRLSY